MPVRCSMLGAMGTLLAGADDPASLYESDEFRLYCFKILPCSRRVPHEWSSCPFAHPTEKAKRRNIRTHSYDCEMCPAIVNGGECSLGSGCPHSHNVFESWLHPQKYRTLLCKDKNKCTRAVCFFAHGEAQLRTPPESAGVPHAGQLEVPASRAVTGLASYSSQGAAQSPYGISHAPPTPQLGQQLHTSRAPSWPLAGPTPAYSSGSDQTVDMQQTLSTLVQQTRIAQQEADQQRAAAQKAEAWLHAVSAALVEEQAAVTAAGSQPLSMSMRAGSSLGALHSAEADISMGCHKARSSSSLQLLHQQQQQPPPLRSPFPAAVASALEPASGSTMHLLQLAGPQCTDMHSVQPNGMTTQQLLGNASAAGWGTVSGAGLNRQAGIRSQSATRGQGTAGVNAHIGPGASAPLALLTQGHALDAAALYGLQGAAAHVSGLGAPHVLTSDAGTRASNQSYLTSGTAVRPLMPLQPWTALQASDCSMVLPAPQHIDTNGQRLLGSILLPFRSNMYAVGPLLR